MNGETDCYWERVTVKWIQDSRFKETVKGSRSA